jgi:hypothetical protein
MTVNWGEDENYELEYEGDNRPCWIWPEYDLLIEMIKQAVRDMRSIEVEVREDAFEWIMNEESPETPMSFDWICRELDLDVTTMRSKMTLLYENIRSTPLPGIRSGRPREMQRPELTI